MILIVDNNIQIRSFLKQILEKLGYDIITAKNGEEAYEKIKNFPLALVLSEIQLPLLNGLQLLQKVKNKLRVKNFLVGSSLLHKQQIRIKMKVIA